MSRFRNELRVIPAAARVTAALAYAATATLMVLFVMYGNDKDVDKAPEIGKFFLIVGLGIFPAIWVLLIGYVYGDSKRRGMRHVMWTLLAIFIPDAIGIILYFILRDPLMRACPGCAQPAKSGFAFCTHCGASLQPTCQNCGRAVEPGWANCPYCGTKLPSPAAGSR
ncbi:MAG: zinc ribbon domain-containing protein [Candidatus Acidiferrales bacterium]